MILVETLPVPVVYISLLYSISLSWFCKVSSIAFALLVMQILTQAVTLKANQKKLVAQQSLRRYFGNLLPGAYKKT